MALGGLMQRRAQGEWQPPSFPDPDFRNGGFFVTMDSFPTTDFLMEASPPHGVGAWRLVLLYNAPKAGLLPDVGRWAGRLLRDLGFEACSRLVSPSPALMQWVAGPEMLDRTPLGPGVGSDNANERGPGLVRPSGKPPY